MGILCAVVFIFIFLFFSFFLFLFALVLYAICSKPVGRESIGRWDEIVVATSLVMISRPRTTLFWSFFSFSVYLFACTRCSRPLPFPPCHHPIIKSSLNSEQTATKIRFRGRPNHLIWTPDPKGNRFKSDKSDWQPYGCGE
jgi:hypothetical protein